MKRALWIAFALTLTALVLALPGVAAVSQGGVTHVASLSTRPFARFIEPQPQHGTMAQARSDASRLTALRAWNLAQRRARASTPTTADEQEAP